MKLIQFKPNCFEKTKVRWEKYFKIMVKLVQTTIRSTELSIAYSPCYSIVLMCYNVDAMSSGGMRAKNFQNTENYERRTNIE